MGLHGCGNPSSLCKKSMLKWLIRKASGGIRTRGLVLTKDALYRAKLPRRRGPVVLSSFEAFGKKAAFAQSICILADGPGRFLGSHAIRFSHKGMGCHIVRAIDSQSLD